MKSLMPLAILIVFSTSLFSQWTTIKDFPTSVQDGAFAVTGNGKAYIGGGLMGLKFYEYDPVGNNYKALKDVPSPGSLLGWAFAFAIGNKIYVCGGSYATASDLTDHLWEYNISEDTWTQKTSFPGGPRDAGFAFAMNGKGYIGCGFNGSIQFDAYEYDPTTDKWTAKTSFPGGATIFPTYFVIGAKTYVGLGAGSSEKADFYEYDPANDKWTQKASFAGSLRQANYSFSYKTKGYVGGGMVNYASSYQDFWEYDVATDKWAKLNITTIPTSNTAWGIAFVVSNRFYVGLGVEMPSFNNDQKIYTHEIDDPTLSVELTGEKNSFKVFPNPATDHLIVQFEGGIESVKSLHLKGPSGQEIPISYELNQSGIDVILTEKVLSGWYALDVRTTDKHFQTIVVIR